MRNKILALAATIALLSVSLSTVGFSLLQIQDRNANISVSADDANGLIALEPGSSSVVDIDGDGLLNINLDDQLQSSANGLNPDARLELGDDQNDSVNAFRAVNGYSQDVELNVSFDNVGVPQDGGGNNKGQIEVYQNGNNVATLDGSSTTGSANSLTLTPGEAAVYDLHFVTERGVAGGDAFNLDINIEASEA